VATVKWDGMEIQVLVNPAESMEALIGTFDWSVCLFGFDGQSWFKGEPLEHIAAGKSLRLQRVTFPLSTLRRGFRFSERFRMKLERADVLTLCKAITDKAAKDSNVGPSGNEPDMPALAANVLVDNQAEAPK
jgi:hypothetical protein